MESSPVQDTIIETSKTSEKQKPNITTTTSPSEETKEEALVEGSPMDSAGAGEVEVLIKEAKKPNPEDEKLADIIIICGYLGSGKTTLIKYILHE